MSSSPLSKSVSDRRLSALHDTNPDDIPTPKPKLSDFDTNDNNERITLRAAAMETWTKELELWKQTEKDRMDAVWAQVTDERRERLRRWRLEREIREQKKEVIREEMLNNIVPPPEFPTNDEMENVSSAFVLLICANGLASSYSFSPS